MDNLIQPQRYPFLGGADELRSLGLTVNGCGYTNQRSDIRDRNSWVHPDYCLVYFFKGEGVFDLKNGKWAKLQPGTVFVTCPGDENRYGTFHGGEFHEMWINFSGGIADHLFDIGMFSVPTRFLPIGYYPHLVDICTEVIKLSADYVNGVKMDNPKRIPGLTIQLLHEIDMMLSRPTNEPINKVIDSIAVQIRNQPEKDWNFEWIAKKNKMSYSLLRKQFTIQFKCPPQRYVVKERMRMATQLLIEGTPVKETCVRVGMDDPYHFSRLFKQHIGQSPRNYVQSIREDLLKT